MYLSLIYISYSLDQNSLKSIKNQEEYAANQTLLCVNGFHEIAF